MAKDSWGMFRDMINPTLEDMQYECGEATQEIERVLRENPHADPATVRTWFQAAEVPGGVMIRLYWKVRSKPEVEG